MKIGDFPIVEALVDARAHLLALHEVGRISLEIDGRRMEPAFTEALEPAIRQELRRRVATIESELEQRGVTFD